MVAPKVAAYGRERREIAVGLLKPAPWNPRAEITPESVADLAASIASLGVIQPLVAMGASDGSYTVIAGHRRLVAARAAGLGSVPCDVLKGVDEATARRMTFIENLQRRDADPLLESGLVESLAKGGMTQDEIAAEAGRGREWVARRMNLSRLSRSWRKRVAKGERITTDCLEHVAAYPDAVQERLKDARAWNADGAVRWSDVSGAFARETADLKSAGFDRAACRACPNNTGCSPDLFDWDGKPGAFGKCLDPKCYGGKCKAAVTATIEGAKARGCEIRRTKQHPDYSIDLQDRPDARHTTLYVWEDYNGETVTKWGDVPKSGKPDGGMTEERKEARKRKVAANRARRKLAAWCEGNLAGVIAGTWVVDAQVALAFQRVFDVGSAWRVFGSQTNAADAARMRLLNPDARDVAPTAHWANLAASEIAAKLVKAEVGARYAELLVAILPTVADALTDEERELVAPEGTVRKLREPVKVAWTSEPADGEAEDSMLVEADDDREV